MGDITRLSGAAVLFLFVAAVDCEGGYRVIGSHDIIKVLRGQDVILPCYVEPPVDVRNLTVEWRHSTTLMHVYRNRKDDLTLQHNEFKRRTSLFHDEMGKGNVSVLLSRLNKEDEGDYTCFIPKLKSDMRRGYVSLIVEDKDEPEPVVDSIHNVGVDLGVGLAMLSVPLIMVV